MLYHAGMAALTECHSESHPPPCHSQLSDSSQFCAHPLPLTLLFSVGRLLGAVSGQPLVSLVTLTQRSLSLISFWSKEWGKGRSSALYIKFLLTLTYIYIYNTFINVLKFALLAGHRVYNFKRFGGI